MWKANGHHTWSFPWSTLSVIQPPLPCYSALSTFIILAPLNLCTFALIYAHSSCMLPTQKVILLIFSFWVNFLFKQDFDVYLLEPPTPMWVTKPTTDRVLLATHLSHLSFCRWVLAVEEGQRETVHCVYRQDSGAKRQDFWECSFNPIAFTLVTELKPNRIPR